ncbi:MAG: response regulator transcription factor [Burkholderiaceae bacterium]
MISTCFERSSHPTARIGRWPDPLRDDQNARVLVIDDSSDIRYLLDFFLRSASIDVDLVGDGLAAMRWIDDRSPPDLVLLDRMLPTVSGERILGAMRSREAWDAVPVVFVSALATSSDVATGLSLGASAYVTKPFVPIEVVRLIGELLAGELARTDRVPDRAVIVQ